MKHINKQKVTKAIGVAAVGVIAFAAGIRYSERKLGLALMTGAHRGKTINYVYDGFEYVVSLSATPVKD